MSPLRTITLWPDHPVVVPDVPRCVQVEANDEVLFFELGEEGDTQAVGDELYLREAGVLDLGSAEAIADFVRSNGPVGRPGLADLPERERLSLLASIPQPRLDEEVEAWSDEVFVQSLEEIRVYIRLMRDLGRMNQARRAGPKGIHWLPKNWQSAWLPPPGSVEQAEDLLANFLSFSLRDYHVRYEIREEREDKVRTIFPKSEDVVVGTTYLRGSEQPWLFGAMCLQLFNHICEDAAYRKCQNPKCKRSDLFVRQRGRATKGRYRMEGHVAYCSTECARAVDQIRCRKRKQEVRRLHAEGAELPEIVETVWGKYDEAKAERARQWIAEGTRTR